MKTYSVHVGNIGQTYSGPSRAEAFKHFAEYVSQSKTNYGCAAGESVVLMLNGTTLREHIGALDAAEANESQWEDMAMGGDSGPAQPSFDC